MVLEQGNQCLLGDLQQVTIEKRQQHEELLSKIGAIWLDNARSLQPNIGSISSKQVSKVFSAQVEVSTSSCHQAHILISLSNFCSSHFGCPIASRNIVEDSKPFHIVIDNLACVISFNIVSIPEHPIVLGLSWFKLHNLRIGLKKILTISLQSQGMMKRTNVLICSISKSFHIT
ncbi:hypothetical protein KP509_05G035500 [Ceratopteris richardii]|uniref:Uncharacterized protein n=1 Tax=Ceratopteris richardii TaxID=49495 RepID=A0A8T2UKU2_CERRI|nr:hypothetical protein KP509_05G035500 [Ceratopteris richardii]